MSARIRVALFAAAVLIAPPLSAQGVIVQSVSDVKMYGALGAIANAAARFGGQSLNDIRSTTSIAGHKLRTETSDGASIVDVDAGRLIHIDHKQKTYESMTFEQLAAAVQQAAQSGQQSAQRAKDEPVRDPNAPKGDVKFKTSVAVDRTGQREKIAGYDAERVFITVTIEAEAKPEGEKAEQVGSMVFLVDHWRSRDVPQIAALEEFQRAYAQRVGQTFRPPMKAIEAAASSDPRIKVGFEASANELAKLTGVPTRSITYAAIVPAGLTFDRALVLGDASAAANAKQDEQPRRGGFRGLMGAIKSAAEQANKQTPAEQNASQQPKQVTLLAVSEEVKSIERGAVPAETVAPPSGYREVTRRAP